MKYFTACLLFILCMICSWAFLTTLCWLLSTDIAWKMVATNNNQYFGLVFLYWWCPGAFLLEDLSKKGWFN